MPSFKFPKEVSEFLRGRGDVLTVHKSGPGTQALLAAHFLLQGQDMVLVVPGPAELHLMRALLGLLVPPRQGANGAQRCWTWLPPYEPGAPRGADWARRWSALRFLAQGKAPAGLGRGLLTTVDNLLPKWPPLSAARVASLELRRGEDMAPDLILDQAAAWGYRRESMVTQVGEMAARGDILDIFAPGFDAPLRLAFFGDVLEDIRLFDPATQRSQAELTEATILPSAPALLCGAELQDARAHLDHLKTTGQINEAHRHDLLDRLERGDAAIHPGLFYPSAVNLEAYLPAGAVFLLAGATQLRPRLEEARWAWQEHMEAVKRDKGFTQPEAALIWPEEQARKAWTGRRQLVFEDLVLGGTKGGLDLVERVVEEFSDLFWKPDERQRPFHALVGALREWNLEPGQTILSFHTERGRKKFLSLAEQEGLSFKTAYALDDPGLFALVAPLKKGFELGWRGSRILPEEVLQPRKEGERAGKSQAFVGLSRFDDLSPGELLVHRDYGLGRFGGLERLTLGEVANDYLLVLFDGDDKLFLPVDRLRMVQRYKGPEGADPVLDSLRGGRWARTKERAKKAVEAIARELVEMYAYRKVAKGYAYKPAGELFLEFEAGFGFEETPDQAKAITEVIADMERPEPMDRLVCGDVGFGKTEVAMRAAFRAVLEGRQVALLCPTTVLAEQHYLNFKNRFQSFPVSVGMLSRFVPKPQQKKVIDAAGRGQVDILVGTHRLISQDVAMPKLGLLILDEEQRFGVKHKERLKELKKNIDCLTLTATPIPRTLQLSLSGIRGLSLIETPPVDRKPVETALIEKDKPLLRNIVQRELERGGQVFWVHNRVQTLTGITEYVRELVPGARIGMAHGQMAEKELEETIHKFWHREMDVLVCTAIIESGLDFPNANTMIVDQAQMFGLGQLYQLRGRVGRSDRQAYAYFVVPSLDGLSDLARKRLKVILDMDFLGAGFHVAMEDLRLRGAGNILGEAQSGQIARVGLDMYLEMLEEEVRRLKGEQVAEAPEPEINFVFPAHIPEKYLPDAGERLRAYRQLAAAETDQALAEASAELADRFGRIPQELENFLAVLRLKGQLQRLGVLRADLFPNRAVLAFSEKAGIVTPERILTWLQNRGEWAKLSPPAKLETRLPETKTPAENLEFLRLELQGLLPEEVPAA